MKEDKNMNAEQYAEVVQPQNEIDNGAENTAEIAEPQEPFKTFATEQEWQGEIDKIIGSRLKEDRLMREKAEKFDRIIEARDTGKNSDSSPQFDFEEELKNPKFASLIAEHGISADDAYYLCHRDSIISRARSAVAADISARRSRIAESGTESVPAASAFINPSRLTDSQIDDIFERVQGGEKITF